MYKILPFILMIFVSACGPETVKLSKPSWINNPEQGAVGSSTTHVRGRHYQEELAISRARERLAARYGVEVSSVQTIKERVINNKAYVTSDKAISQTVKNKEVKAHVRKVWHDSQRDELWVWIYPIN